MKLYNRSEHKELRRFSTHTEKLIWRRIRNSQITGVRFRRQYGIDNFVLDFYAPEVRLAIELDGTSHDLEGRASRDKWRQSIIEGYKITFLRFTDDEVMKHIDGVLKTIEQAVKSLLRLLR